MKTIIFWFLVLFLIVNRPAYAQFQSEYLGFAGLIPTCISIYDGIAAIGTDSHGVYWQPLWNLPDSSWNYISLGPQQIHTVYTHKSGPLGWAISAGVTRGETDADLIFCSYMGGEFAPNSDGIDPNLTYAVMKINGFPDPTVCGESYAAGGRALYRRSLGSENWEIVYGATYEGEIQTVQTHNIYPGVVVAGGGDGFAGILLIKSLDYGDTWQEISPMGFINSTDFYSPDADTIFAIAGVDVFRTFDGGQNWENVFLSNIPEWIYFHKVIIDQMNKRVYIAGGIMMENSALFYSDDWGENWNPIPTFFHTPIVDMALDYEGKLYLVNQTQGVYRITPSGNSIEDSINQNSFEFMLGQNYPNPFNPNTTIPFTLRKSGNIIISVFNAQGQKIDTILDQYQTAGSYEIIWKPVNQSSGYYFYRLESDTNTQTRTMLYIK